MRASRCRYLSRNEALTHYFPVNPITYSTTNVIIPENSSPRQRLAVGVARRPQMVPRGFKPCRQRPCGPHVYGQQRNNYFQVSSTTFPTTTNEIHSDGSPCGLVAVEVERRPKFGRGAFIVRLQEPWGSHVNVTAPTMR